MSVCKYMVSSKMNRQRHLFRLITVQKHDLVLRRELQQSNFTCNKLDAANKFTGDPSALSRASSFFRHSSNYSNTVAVRQKEEHILTKKKNAITTELTDALADLYPVRYVFVQTCSNQWIEAPDGVIFDAGYADSLYGTDKCDATAPVIVGIPSSFGTHLELTTLLKPFVKLGYRVILLNMPESKYCPGYNKGHSTMFEQSIEDRSKFIRDILAELNIPKVHMLIANSCSVYCAVNVASAYKDLIQSLALINPTGMDYTQLMKPLSFHRRCAHIWDDRILLQPVISGLLGMYKRLTKKSAWATNDIITYSRIIRNFKLNGAGEEVSSDIMLAADGVQTAGVPLLAIYGEDAENFCRTSTQDYLHLLGLSTVHEGGLQTMNTSENGAVKSCSVYLKGQPAHLASMELPTIRRTLLTFSRALKPNL